MVKEKETLKKLGLEIKLERIKRGLSQKQLAQKVGCATTAICHWERGNRCPSFLAIKALKSALKIEF